MYEPAFTIQPANFKQISSPLEMSMRHGVKYRYIHITQVKLKVTFARTSEDIHDMVSRTGTLLTGHF